MSTKRDNKSSIGGIVFVGCMFIGLALGMLYNRTSIGVLLGMGIGFVAMGAIWAYYGRK